MPRWAKSAIPCVALSGNSGRHRLYNVTNRLQAQRPPIGGNGASYAQSREIVLAFRRIWPNNKHGPTRDAIRRKIALRSRVGKPLSGPVSLLEGNRQPSSM